MERFGEVVRAGDKYPARFQVRRRGVESREQVRLVLYIPPAILYH